MIKRILVTLGLAINLIFIAACSEPTLDIPIDRITADYTVLMTDEDAEQALIYSSLIKGESLATFLVLHGTESLTSYVAGKPYPLTFLEREIDGGQYSTMYQTKDKLLPTSIKRGASYYQAMIDKPNLNDEIIIDFQRANGEIFSSNGFVHNIPTVTSPIAESVIPKSQQEITVSWGNLDATQQGAKVKVESYVRCAAFQELGAGNGIEDNWDHLTEKGGFSTVVDGSKNSVILRRSEILQGITPEEGIDRCLAIVAVSSLVQGTINPKFWQGLVLKSRIIIAHQAERLVYYIDI